MEDGVPAETPRRSRRGGIRFGNRVVATNGQVAPSFTERAYPTRNGALLCNTLEALVRLSAISQTCPVRFQVWCSGKT
jgi:hypothetical protein